MGQPMKAPLPEPSANELPGEAVGLEEFVATAGMPCGEGALVAWAAMERAADGANGVYCASNAVSLAART